MATNQNPLTGFTDTFFSKLKEQSFTIILMVGVIWYQGRMMEERVAYWQKLYEEREAYIQQTTKEDKENFQDRINYLQDQRDKYVETAFEELKNK
jgi:exosome complex RNA-binding protein Rrp4